MKKTAIILLAATLAFTGCSSVKQALKITQTIEGSGTITTSKPIGHVTIQVENARQEDGRFHADKIDIVATSPLGKTEAHLTDYSRPLIKE